MGMDRTYAWVIESRLYGIGLNNLTIGCLQNESTATMEDTSGTTVDGGSGEWSITSFATSFSSDEMYLLIVQVVVEGTDGIGPTTYASHEVVRVISANLRLQLHEYLLTNDAL